MPTFTIALGGGTAIDLAKLIGALAMQPMKPVISPSGMLLSRMQSNR